MFILFFIFSMAVAWFAIESKRKADLGLDQDYAHLVPWTTRLQVLYKAIPVCVAFSVVASYIAPTSDKEPKKAPSTAAPTEMSFAQALTKCQYAIKDMSKDPESAEVPYVEDFGSGNEYYFAWGAQTKPVRMTNSFGAMLSAGASCTVNKSTGKIAAISLDGKSVY